MPIRTEKTDRPAIGKLYNVVLDKNEPPASLSALGRPSGQHGSGAIRKTLHIADKTRDAIQCLGNRQVPDNEWRSPQARGRISYASGFGAKRAKGRHRWSWRGPAPGLAVRPSRRAFAIERFDPMPRLRGRAAVEPGRRCLGDRRELSEDLLQASLDAGHLRLQLADLWRNLLGRSGNRCGRSILVRVLVSNIGARNRFAIDVGHPTI